jgi:hypothetical protein
MLGKHFLGKKKHLIDKKNAEEKTKGNEKRKKHIFGEIFEQG